MKPLIIALDVESDKEALSLIKATKKYADLYKVGPGLVLKYGPAIFKKIKKAGKKIFLDMKFHDIPNTMVRSIQAAAKLSLYSATVHTAAGVRALASVSAINRRPLIWGVTVLTSLSHDDMVDLGYRHSPLDQVISLARLAKRGRLDGLVASVGETAQLRSLLGPKMNIVTPGIRLPENAVGDQKRVATPADARMAGSTFIVVGRPIVESKNPGLMAENIVRDWKRGIKK